MLAIAAAAWLGGPKHVGAELVALEWSEAPPHSSCWFLAMQLPDGTQIEIGPDRFAVPEVLFNPVGPSTLCNARLCQLADKSMVCRCTTLHHLCIKPHNRCWCLRSRCYQALGLRR